MLGSWEQYTKGFGSKIMSKMGYIHGSGLGVNRDGRVEPVPAVIYPTGKSLGRLIILFSWTGAIIKLMGCRFKIQMQK